MSANLFPGAIPRRFRHAASRNADRLVFAQQPAALTAGQPFPSTITINILNATGALDTASSAAVTLTIAGSGTLTGTTTVSATAGIATFPDITVTSAGIFRLSASEEASSPATSARFAVSPDASLARLVVTKHPLGALVGKDLSPPIVVALQDPFGNILTDNRTPMALVISAGPRGGTLTGRTTLTSKSGVAQFRNLSLPLAGTYTLQASDPALATATSDPFQIIIAPGVTTITAPHSGGTAAFGGAVTLSASLRSTADRKAPFTGAATLLDQNNAVLGSVLVSPSGRIAFVVTGLGLGAYACRIAYAGDANHTSLVSTPFPLQITAAPTRVALSSAANQLVFGQDVQLNAAVTTPFNPSSPPTGTVTFLDRGVQIGSVPVNGAGTASLTVPGESPGTHVFSAIYSGDGEFRFSAAQPRSFNVDKVPTVTALRAPMSPFLKVGQLVALTLHVFLPLPGQTPPSGTLTVKDGQNVLATLPVDSDGSARLTTSFSTRGPHRLTAEYSGDAFNQSSTSAPFLEFVTA